MVALDRAPPKTWTIIVYSPPAAYWSGAETQHIDGIADGSRAPALAVKIATLISAFATASCANDPLDPMASSSPWTRIYDIILLGMYKFLI
jgi:hypothetical protein